MFRYDADSTGHQSFWDEIDDQERIDLIIEYHEKVGHEVENLRIHAALHAVVENQVLLGDETPVEAALQRLQEEGLSRHEAIHAIGSVLAGVFWRIGQGSVTDGVADQYFEDVKKLTASEWLDGFERN